MQLGLFELAGKWELNQLPFILKRTVKHLHVQLADEAYCIGPTSSKDSYLNVTNIISVAKLTGCDAIHPGYGFLAENADFAELCRECNIIFVGPSPEAITKMGTKDIARETMREAGVPIVPGSTGIIKDIDEAIELANKIEYPVIIKATAGGGGKGFVLPRMKQELIKGINITQQEALTAFGNPGVYIEKYIEDFRHVEIQVLADTLWKHDSLRRKRLLDPAKTSKTS